MIVHCKVPRNPLPQARIFRMTGKASERAVARVIRGLGARFIKARVVEGRIIVHYWPATFRG